MNTDLRDQHADDAFVDGPAYLDEQALREGDASSTDVSFAAIRDELRADRTWSQPPISLRDSILARAREQASTATAPAVTTDSTPVTESNAVVDESGHDAAEGIAEAEPQTPVRPARGQQPRWRARWGRLVWAIPVTAAAAVVFAIGVIAVDRALQPNPPAAQTFVATGTQLAPEARATVTVSGNWGGFSVVLEPTGLPGAAPGSYYAAWLRGPNGYVPLGSFHERRSGGEIVLWSGVDPQDYDTLVITLQAEGDPPTPSTLVVMTASLTR